MQAIIPAAGYATRLYPLTENQPKHLLEVRGKPIIEHVIKKILELPVKKIFIVSNEKYFKNFSEWLKKNNSSVSIELLNDHTKSNDDRLGQIGDIQFAIEKQAIDDSLLIIAGDNLFNFSLKPCFVFFKKKNAPVNVIKQWKEIEPLKQLGVVKVDGEKIVEFEEKPEKPKSFLSSTGIYFFPKKHVKLFKQYIKEGNNADKMGYFMTWLVSRQDVFAFQYNEKWFDIGMIEALEEARREFNE